MFYNSENEPYPTNNGDHIDLPSSFLDALNENGVDFNAEWAPAESTSDNAYLFSQLQDPSTFEGLWEDHVNTEFVDTENYQSSAVPDITAFDGVASVNQAVPSEHFQSSLNPTDTKLEATEYFSLDIPQSEESRGPITLGGTSIDGIWPTSQFVEAEEPSSSFIPNEVALLATAVCGISPTAQPHEAGDTREGASTTTGPFDLATSLTSTVGSEQRPGPVNLKRKREPTTVEGPQTLQAANTITTSETSCNMNRAPKRHKLKHIDELKTPDTPCPSHQPELVRLLKKSPTFKYQGHIKSQSDAVGFRNAYNDLSSSHTSRHASQPETDSTFPQSEEDYRARISELFEAICDWSHGYGWRARMGSDLAKAWLADVAILRKSQGLEADLSKVSDDLITPPEDRMPSIEEQWMKVVHHKMSDIEIEMLCSKILVSNPRNEHSTY